MPTTNILMLPVVVLGIEVSNNADWLDGCEYWTDETHDTNLDLTGIGFEMEMRAAPPDQTVVLLASTKNGLIKVYLNTWQFAVPASMMGLVPPGSYVFDMLGTADGFTRNLV